MEIIEVDPRDLRLLSSRNEGAEPIRLHQQLAEFGGSIESMPPIQVLRMTDGAYLIQNGVTRATRAAMLHPGVKIRATVEGSWPRHSRWYRRLEETLP